MAPSVQRRLIRPIKGQRGIRKTMGTKRQITVNVEDSTVRDIDKIAAAAGVYNRSLIVELALERFCKWAASLSEKEVAMLVQFQSEATGNRPVPIRRTSGTYSFVEHAPKPSPEVQQAGRPQEQPKPQAVQRRRRA